METKTYVTSFVIIVSVLLFAFIGNSFSQPWLRDSTEETQKAFFEHEDGNGDGKVTKEEYKGPDDHFEFFDKNKDGVIDKSEAPTLDHLPEGGGHGGSQGSGPDAVSSASVPVTDLASITLNGVEFKVNSKYVFFTWNDLPSDVIYERMPMKDFTGPDGATHYYEAVHLPSGNLNWFQAAFLAQDAGGYLACPTSEEENTFIFNLVNDRKFFWFFPPYNGSGKGNHYEIGIGPWLGGYQSAGAPEPAGGWKWLSGEEMVYINWAKDLNDGVIDRDPRDNTQPNNSGSSNQRIMGFGEMNEPVPTWGDYMDDTGTYGTMRKPGSSYGFVIEYNSNPGN